ncbi:hypothetical protein LPJ57_001278 [Coemansia sp. RSA 486]|nr:hypothetical protein LPJ57_001278 [Coemansia sp. RSA 486]KAJ2237477.1 hypothetical protein IWW45_000927 [Coemansia sp. RSA 485]KAJ2638341.1 hypothetical protein GGF40_001728 [Coemansia sp. RSA 1286]
MKTNAAALALFATTFVSAIPVEYTYEEPAPTTKIYHELHTFTNEQSDAVIVDYGVSNVGVYIEGNDGIDGIYSHFPKPDPYQTHELHTWADDQGLNAVIDYANPYHYTVFQSGTPVATLTEPTPSVYEDDTVEHHLRTFTNQLSQTVLIDYAVSDMAVVMLGNEGFEDADGIYNADEVPGSVDVSRTDTWVNDLDGVKAVIDYAHPEHYTVYDMSDNPIATVGN